MRNTPRPDAKCVLLVGLLVTWLSASGCGLKGPLYRPGERSQNTGKPAESTGQNKAPMSERMPAPQAQKNDTSAAPADPPAVIDPDRPAPSAPGTP